MSKHYDAIIIGAGAGLKIARPAGDLGYKMAVIDPGPLGGTCLNRGCIPSKMLIHPADVVQSLKEASSVEVTGEAKINLLKLVSRVSHTIDDESKSIIPLLENHKNVDWYPSAAKFIGPKEVLVGSKRLKGDKIFIATGARTYVPPIPGLKDVPYVTSTEVLKANHLPKKMMILGAGYIACELGHYLDALGIEVHFIVRSRFLRHLDHDIQKEFESSFSHRFKVHLGEVTEVNYENNQFKLKMNNQTLESDGLLVAAGMAPNTESLDLEHAGVEVNGEKFIKVDDHLMTSAKDVYAYGDVIGRYFFRHSANFEGEYLLKEHFQNPKSNQPIQYPPVPCGVFTWPQVAAVGKKETELEKDTYIVGINRYKDSAMGMALNQDTGLCKLLFDKQTHQLLGAHIVGEQATTMIHMLIAYMNMNAKLEDLLRTIYIHPALPEIVRNAARKARAQLKG